MELKLKCIKISRVWKYVSQNKGKKCRALKISVKNPQALKYVRQKHKKNSHAYKTNLRQKISRV